MSLRMDEDCKQCYFLQTLHESDKPHPQNMKQVVKISKTDSKIFSKKDFMRRPLERFHRDQFLKLLFQKFLIFLSKNNFLISDLCVRGRSSSK